MPNKDEAMHQIFNNEANTFDTVQLNKNLVVFSALKEFYHTVKSQGFAIRYVVDGTEHYRLNGCDYPVGAGQYLLSNAESEGFVAVESAKKVNGICLNITPELLADVAATMRRPDTPYADMDLGLFFSSNLFFENIYDIHQTHLGKCLFDINTSLQKEPLHQKELNIEFFYLMCEKIIADQAPVFKQLQTIPSIKAATKKDLLRRILKAKGFIDSGFIAPLTIETVAKEVCLSEYHFFRLFKSVLGLSPHQYILKKRLEYAQNILKFDKNAVSFAAYESGFADIHAFSKAFKKHFGYAPSALLKEYPPQYLQ